MKRFTVALAVALALALGAAPCEAGSVSFGFTKPFNSSDSDVTIAVRDSNGALQDTVTATIPPNITAQAKRDLIHDALVAKGYTVSKNDPPNGDPGITISAIRDGWKVYFRPGSTKEKKDSETASNALLAAVRFDGWYTTVDEDGEVSTFTAGVITSLGQVAVEYRAIDAGGEPIHGVEIAERLYWDLFDAAADLGATLTLDGEEIAASFEGDSGSDSDSGIIFGTSAPEDGVEARVELAPGNADAF